MYEVVKRGWDILIASMGIMISLPIDIVIAIFIKLTSEGKIIFKQERLRKKWKKNHNIQISNDDRKCRT